MLCFQRLRIELYKNPLAQAIQVMEEAGELAEKVGLLTGATGKRKEVPLDIKEQVVEEAIDVAQAACGIIWAMEKQGVDIEKMMKKHLSKMFKRGYLDQIK